MKILTIDFVVRKISSINPNILILSDEYVRNNVKLKCKCLIDGHEWLATYANLSKPNGNNRKCPVCTGSVVSDKNRISKLRPDLLKYFKYKEDANNYGIGSHFKADLICPNCKHEKSMDLASLYNQGFSCKICSDGVSIPEKFISNILKELGVYFLSEKIFKWSDTRRYDFYIPEFGIIECHGRQHYKEVSRGRSLEEEQNNDITKERLAKENDIEHYIIIDCRISSFKFLKESFIKELFKYFDLLNVDWDKIWEETISSKILKSWDMYSKEMDYKKVSKILNIGMGTVRKYIKIGIDIGAIS